MVPFLSRQTHGGGSGNLVLDDELKPIHHKDIKPPPEFSGARKDLVAWHESFASTLRCTTPKWATVIDWIKGPQEKRIIDEAAQAEYEKTIGTAQFETNTMTKT